jgi:hypothetical protein
MVVGAGHTDQIKEEMGKINSFFKRLFFTKKQGKKVGNGEECLFVQ